jgi:hypothetical protein
VVGNAMPVGLRSKIVVMPTARSLVLDGPSLDSGVLEEVATKARRALEDVALSEDERLELFHSQRLKGRFAEQLIQRILGWWPAGRLRFVRL